MLGLQLISIIFFEPHNLITCCLLMLIYLILSHYHKCYLHFIFFTRTPLSFYLHYSNTNSIISLFLSVMEGYVNVNFLRGGMVIRQSSDIKYSMDSKVIRFISLGINFEDIKNMVLEVMNLSQTHWRVKMTYKYSQIGIGNVVLGYYLGNTDYDIDVCGRLMILETMRMRLGDVSLYIKTKKIQVYEPYSYEYNILSQQTHSSFQEDYGRSNFYPQFETAE